jgi:hypothetical protein
MTTILLYKVVRSARRLFGKAVVAVHTFHVRYRWAFVLIVVVLVATALWGFGEVGKALWGLTLEQVLLRIGELS